MKLVEGSEEIYKYVAYIKLNSVVMTWYSVFRLLYMYMYSFLRENNKKG